MSIDVLATCDLVSCKESQVLAVAQKHKVPSSVASVVRTHYTRRVTDRCVQCGRFLDEGKCHHCNLSAMPAFELLQELKPKAILIRTKCATCDRMMSFRAGHILKVTKEHGFFRPPKECPRCKAKKEASKGMKKAKSKKKVVKKRPSKSKSKTSRKPVKKPVAPKPKTSTDLRHNPFMALKGLKIEK